MNKHISREESPVLLHVCSRLLGTHLDVWRYTLRTTLIT